MATETTLERILASLGEKQVKLEMAEETIADLKSENQHLRDQLAAREEVAP